MAAAGAATEDPREAFERRLGTEILAAERFRATLLAVLPTVAMLAFLAVSSAYPDAVTALMHGKFDRAPVGLFLCAVAGFEFHVLYATEKMLRNGTRPSAARRYVNAFVETSLPTLVIVYYVTIVGPVEALLMPTRVRLLRLHPALDAAPRLRALRVHGRSSPRWSTPGSRSSGRRATPTVRDPVLTSLPHHLGKALHPPRQRASRRASSRAACGGASRRALESLEERARILSVFGQHVSPEVVERLVAGRPSARSELREVCVMFLDIRNFTAFSEKHEPGGGRRLPQHALRRR